MIDFKDFGIEDNERYKKYLQLCIQIPSNLSPIFLLGRRESFKFQRGYAANLCWHKFSKDGAEFLTAPVGDWDEINWREVFAEHVPAGSRFADVPEYPVKLWQRELGENILIEENRDMWDYILYLDRMEKLEGKKLKAFRQGRNVFEKNYDYTIEDITPKIFDELREFQAAAEEDLQQRVEHLADAQEDNEIFLLALKHWDALKNLFGFVVRVDGQIVAYSIDEAHSIGLFAKANYDFKGINQFNFWYDAKMNRERGILTENIMDDVGEENLRFFKEHLNPLVMLKKFVVTYKPVAKEESSAHELNFSAQRDDDRLTMKLSGKFNTDAANVIKDKILSTLDDAKDVTFDLDGLEYISSSGLRILIAALKKVRAQGGTMTLKHVDEQVREVLDITGFAQIFNVEA